MGNLIRVGCQNRLQPMAKFSRVPTSRDLPCEEQNKKGLQFFRCPVYLENLKIAVKSKKRVFTSSQMSLFSPEIISEDQKNFVVEQKQSWAAAN